MSLAGLDDSRHKPSAAGKILGQIPAWLWFGAGLFLLFVIGGNRALQDADTYWQIVVGQWIIDHRAFRLSISIRSQTGAPWIRRLRWRRCCMPHLPRIG